MFTSPRVIVPVLLHAFFLFGILTSAATFFAFYLAATAQVNSPVNTLVSLQATNATQVIDAVHSVFFSATGFFALLMLIVFVSVATIVLAYTKAVLLGVIKDIGRKSQFIDMFKHARHYWWPNLKYYIPFAILITITIACGTYTLFLRLFVSEQFGVSAVPYAPQLITFLLAVLIFVLRLMTIYADGVIIGGSSQPWKDSFQAMRSNKAFSSLLIVALLVITLIVWATNIPLDNARQAQELVKGTTWQYDIIGALIFFAWRVYLAATIVAVWLRLKPITTGI